MEEKVLIQVKHLHKLEDLNLKLMNHDMINIRETTLFHPGKSIETKY